MAYRGQSANEFLVNNSWFSMGKEIMIEKCKIAGTEEKNLEKLGHGSQAELRTHVLQKGAWRMSYKTQVLQIGTT